MQTPGNIPLIGDKKPEEQPTLPMDAVPDGYIIRARVGELDIYADGIDVQGPLVRFSDAYVCLGQVNKWKRTRNLMFYYSPVRWCNSKAPEWWDKRAEIKEEM